MAMATGVAELATAFSSAAVLQNRGAATWQQGQATLKMQAVGKRSPAVVAASASQRQWVDEESGASAKRSTLLSTAMALAGVAMVATSVAGSAEAAIQKVEGTEREEQDAVTTGIREPSRLSAAKGNTVQEGAKTNTQASGGLILGAPRLDEPAGAYRSPQSSTYSTDEVGSKRSTPAGILQGNSPGQSSTEEAEAPKIGGSAME